MLSKRGKSLKGVIRFQGVTLWLLRDKESPLGGSNMCEDNIFLTCVSKSVNDTFGFFFCQDQERKMYFDHLLWYNWLVFGADVSHSADICLSQWQAGFP